MKTLDADSLLERLEKMGEHIPVYAKAKANRTYIENFLRSKKSLLMAQSDEKTACGREAFAYAHVEYIQLLEGLRAAVEIEESARWALERLRLECDIFRTIQANERYLKNQL